MKLYEIMQAIEGFAPLATAMPWDNVGLLVGDPGSEIEKVFVSLDLTPQTLEGALTCGAQLILTHHPIWLQGIKRLNDPLIMKLISAGIALVALHTNLDVAEKSVNHALAEALELKPLRFLSDESGNKRYRLVVTTPEHARDQIREAAFNAGAGRIGHYDNCMSSFEVHGGFRPGEGSNPALGKRGVRHLADEIRLEFSVDKVNLSACVDKIVSVHPFEAPDIYWHEISDKGSVFGLGLICESANALTLKQLAEHTKDKLGIPFMRYWTAGFVDDFPIRSIAICGGAGSSLIKTAERQAEIIITGDISYHYLLDSKIPILDAGHFYTEYPALRLMAKKINELGLETDTLPQAGHEFSLYNRMV